MLAIVGLYGISIPWYRSGGSEVGLLWGLPSWVSIALACYVLAACANALAWWLTDIPDGPEAPADENRS